MPAIIFQMILSESGQHIINTLELANCSSPRLRPQALAGLAKLGLAQFGRQALVGGNYALLQERTFTPNPVSQRRFSPAYQKKQG